MRQQIEHKEAGFSLAELMVAMVMTLIVTGAIFGLLGTGQSAFKVQPERTERQQNIRTAMDLIMRDAASAGVGMPAFIQTFTPGLDAAGTTNGLAGTPTDEIQMLANTAGFPNEPVCNAIGGGSSTQVKLMRGVSNIPDGTSVLIFFQDGTWTVRQVVSTNANNGGPGPCTVDPHVQLDVNSGGDTSGNNCPGGACGGPGVCRQSGLGLGNAGDPLDLIPATPACGMDNPCCTVGSVGFGELVHYRIRPDATEFDDYGVAIPNLERSVNGQPFQVVARGVEDLQVQYLDQAGNVTDNAPVVDATGVNFATLIVQARITLTTRAATRRLQGATTNAATGIALRGSLSSQATPRQALATLTTEGIAAPKWN